ncbi:hypothetical protein B6N51_12940 [Salmonella enterica subsp. enterica]|nr:hypothetical protein B6N51_12940 [Salmonella enterica subsp. enterica]
MCWLRITRPIDGPRPDGRRTRRSNLFPADLSFTPVTSLSMLLGTHSLVAFKQLELFGVYTMSANR